MATELKKIFESIWSEAMFYGSYSSANLERKLIRKEMENAKSIFIEELENYVKEEREKAIARTINLFYASITPETGKALDKYYNELSHKYELTRTDIEWAEYLTKKESE